MNETVPDQSVVSKPALKVKVFGVGSAGVNILDQLACEGVMTESLIAVHSDAIALSASSAHEKVRIEDKAGRVLKEINDESRVSGTSTEDVLAHLKSLCTGADVIFIIAGLGGALGTDLSALLAAAAREAGAFVLAFVVLPFECEGSVRAKFAETGLKRLKESADLVVCWPNQKTLALIDEATSLIDTFKASNRLLGYCVRAAWRALASETAMGLGFLDLCGSIRQHSAECMFGIAEASGPNRATEALERVLAHPMLENPGRFQQSLAVAVCVLGGNSLAMAEVNRIMGELHRRCEAAPVIMGAAITPELGESLLITLMVALPEAPIEAIAEIEDESATELIHRGDGEDPGAQFLDRAADMRRNSRFVPPAPALPPEKMAQLLKQQSRAASRTQKVRSKLRQTQLPLEIVSKGRFDKSEPTIHKGEDLDVPTYIRRGVALN